ncbi:MAG: pyridoxamine 5'-phosphate oxidase family protein [Lachnospiraceae bacterium]|nr:pyridoxamine 5'-phosphate oxidase family protein [Lachnospiraceae bacterium]
MLNESVKKVLAESLWDLATCADNEPNVVPVGLKEITEDGKLVVGDVFLETTLKNIQSNSKVAIAAYDGKEGYQVKGTAEYVTEGPVLDAMKVKAEELFKGALSAKGALIITPEKVIVTTPGPDNKKVL